MEAVYSTLIVIALMIAMSVFGLMRPDLAGSWYAIGWIVLFLGLALSSGRLNVLSDHFRYRTYVPGHSGQSPAEERNERLAVFAVMFALAFLFRGKSGKDT